jgi:aryl-alcohol dehydrogenase-like predicted oxidoreductase
VEALAELQQQGLIRHIGLSTVTASSSPRPGPSRRSSACRTFYNIARRRTTPWSI